MSEQLPKTHRRSIGHRLRDARDRRRMTLHQLAAKSQVGIGTISEIERHADRLPTTRTLKKLAKALDVSLIDLLGND